MKVAIISDIHDNLANLGFFLNLTKKEEIEKIICLGDITNQETLKILAQGFTGEILLVYGNMEIYSENDIKEYRNINYLGRFGTSQLGNFVVGLCHEPGFIKSLFEKNEDLNFIFYGHTHKPWLSMKNKAVLINPGTLGGVFQKASYAIWDDIDGKIKLKLIHN